MQLKPCYSNTSDLLAHVGASDGWHRGRVVQAPSASPRLTASSRFVRVSAPTRAVPRDRWTVGLGSSKRTSVEGRELRHNKGYVGLSEIRSKRMS